MKWLQANSFLSQMCTLQLCYCSIGNKQYSALLYTCTKIVYHIYSWHTLLGWNHVPHPYTAGMSTAIKCSDAFCTFQMLPSVSWLNKFLSGKLKISSKISSHVGCAMTQWLYIISCYWLFLIKSKEHDSLFIWVMILFLDCKPW